MSRAMHRYEVPVDGPAKLCLSGDPVLIVPFYPRQACCACHVLLSVDQAEPVPSRPWLRRCRDEDACRQRYTPRRLSRSVRQVQDEEGQTAP